MATLHPSVLAVGLLLLALGGLLQYVVWPMQAEQVR
jgi:hypothetical protein